MDGEIMWNPQKFAVETYNLFHDVSCEIHWNPIFPCSNDSNLNFRELNPLTFESCSMWQLIWRFPQMVVSQVTVVVSILGHYDPWQLDDLGYPYDLRNLYIIIHSLVEDGEPPCSMFKLPYDLRNPSDNGQRDQDDAREDRETSHLRWSWWSQPGSTNRKSRFHPISPTKNEALTWFNHELNMLFNDEDPLIHENQNWWHERGNNSIMGNPNSSEGLIANHFMGIQGEYLINIISICIYQENGVSPKVWLF